MKVILLCPHEFDVAHCGITVRNAARSLSLVSYPSTGSSMQWRVFQKSQGAEVLNFFEYFRRS